MDIVFDKDVYASKRYWLDENENNDQTPFKRDISRIIYSNGFQSSGGKTQVYPTDQIKFYFPRTRQLHQIEVAETTKRVCNAIGRNAQLGEAISLAHDIGHPPFGHAGEKVINSFLNKKINETFSNDQQSVRVVLYLEKIRHEFSGLNLTNGVVDALKIRAIRGNIKVNSDHRINYKLNFNNAEIKENIESQVSEKIDKIIYLLHDMEDAFRIGDLKIELLKEMPVINNKLWHKIEKYLKNDFDDVNLVIATIKRFFYNYFIDSLMRECSYLKEELDPQYIYTTNKTAILYEEEVEKEIQLVKNFMYENVYQGKPTIKRDKMAYEIINCLVDYFDTLSFNQLQKFNYLQIPIVNNIKKLHIADIIWSYHDKMAIDVFGQIKNL